MVKTKFTRFFIDIKDYGYKSVNKIQITGTYNNWEIEEEPFKKISDTKYEVVLALKEGDYEYKLILDEKWIPETGNLALIVGENGASFPKGSFGTGTFSYDAIDKNDTKKAIQHDFRKLNYLNKISEKEIEFTIRTQINDVERAFINLDLNEKDSYESILELERQTDFSHGFDYFKRTITFENEIEELSYYFILEDGETKAYFNGNLAFEKPEKIKVNFKKDKIEIFYIPNWAKEAIWYNIFPDRFYNGNHYNDPIFNEFGAETFEINNLHEHKFVEHFKWSKEKEILVNLIKINGQVIFLIRLTGK